MLIFLLFINQMKTIHITVKVYIDDNADAHEVASDCDYSFNHDQIVCTEIVHVSDENEVNVF